MRAGCILSGVPKSKSRSKLKRRYQLEPQRRHPKKKSPRWYPIAVLGVIAAGIAVIVFNYLRGHQATNGLLWAGLGLIALGFLGATRIR